MSLRVVPKAGDPQRGFLVANGLVAPCALGRAGFVDRKREGDGGTPRGAFALLTVFYRPDRVRRPVTRLPVVPIAPDSGWCDDPTDRAYNRPVRLPYPANHERLWRDDHLYDVVVVLDYNMDPVVRGAGSAIFLHFAREDFAPTEGCVAVSPQTMRRILARAAPGTALRIG